MIKCKLKAAFSIVYIVGLECFTLTVYLDVYSMAHNVYVERRANNLE